MSRVTVNQLAKTLKSLLGQARFAQCKTHEHIFDVLASCENLALPFTVDADVSLVEERLMLYNHNVYREKSILCQIAMEKFEQVLMVVDSVLPSKEAIHFVKLTTEYGDLHDWLDIARTKNILIRQLKGLSASGEDWMLVVPLTSFIRDD